MSAISKEPPLSVQVSLVMSQRLDPHTGYGTDFSLKRIIMHAICLLRRPGKAAFFFAGIRREFSLLLL